jgi:rhodanese-related sulfurtransferase
MTQLSTTLSSITPEALHALRQQGQAIDLLDVRTPGEYAAVHAEGARSIPLNQLDANRVKSERAAGIDVTYVICKSGGRSRVACQQLQNAGVNVVNVDGGTDAWVRAGLPVVRGQSCAVFRRGVQIVGLLLALAGAVLAVVIGPWFFVLAVGGLVVSMTMGGCPFSACAPNKSERP